MLQHRAAVWQLRSVGLLGGILPPVRQFSALQQLGTDGPSLRKFFALHAPRKIGCNGLVSCLALLTIV